MANQSWKQQMYQSIANSQVQQVMQQQRDQGIAQLQAEFDAWQKQQNDIAQLQAEYDSWYAQNNPQPVQSAPVQTVKATKPALKMVEKKQEIPSLVNNTADNLQYRQAKRNIALGEKRRESYQRQQQEEQILASREKDKTPKERIDEAINKQTEDTPITSTRDMFSAGSTPTNNIKDMLTQQPEKKPSVITPPEQTANNQQFDEVAKIVEDAAKDWAPWFTYRGSKWENPYDSMTPEQQQIVRDYVQQNKNNPNLSEDERKRLGDFLKVYGGSGDVEDFNDVATAYNNTFSDRMQTLRAGIGGFVNANKPVADLLAKGASKLPIMGQAIDLDEAEKAYDASVTNAMDKNRAAAEIGRGAGQIYDYLVTSPVVGAATSAMGLSGVGASAVNQLVQAGQDIALDVYPEAQRMLKEEGEINWGELAKRFGTDVAMNAAMELIPSLRGVNYDYLTKTVGNNADIFKNMTQSGAYKTIPDIANSIANAASDIKANEAPVENVAKMQMIPGMETESAVVDDINRQFSDLMGSYHPDTSAMRNIYNAEDLNSSLNEQLANAMRASQADEAVESAAKAMPEAPVNEVANNADEVAEAVNNISPIKNDIDEMSDAVTNRILDVGYKVDAANNEVLSKSYRELLDYEEKWAKTVSESTDIEEIRQATKDLNNAISRFNTRAKKVDPSIAKDIYNKKFSSMLNNFNTKLDDFYNGARRTEEATNLIVGSNTDDALKEISEVQAAKQALFDDVRNGRVSAQDFDYRMDNLNRAESKLIDKYPDWYDNGTLKGTLEDYVPSSAATKTMAEDTGIPKGTPEPESVKATFEIPDTPENAPTALRPEGESVIPPEGMNERGTSKHIRNDGTPMQMEGISEEVAADFEKNPDMYKRLRNADTKAKAEQIYNTSDNPEVEFRSLLEKKDPSALPLGHQIAKDYSAAGNHEAAAQIYRDMGKALTESGQFSQAAVINMVKNDPMTAFQFAQKEIDSLNEAGVKRFGDKWKNFELTPDEIKAFEDVKPGDSDAIKAIYEKIGDRLGRDYPTTLLEKLIEARRVAMLFNPRTNVRNFGANPPTLAMRWMSDRVEALGQNVAHLINPDIQVTQSLYGSGIKGRKLATEAYNSARVKALAEGAGSKADLPNLKNSLMERKQVFKGTAVEKWIDKVTDGGIQKANEKLFGAKGVQSVPETIRNATYKLLDLGDRPFVKENFVERLGSYIAATGIKNIDDIPDEAIEIAWEEAMKATYKDNSWAVDMIRNMKKSMEKADNVLPGLGTALSQSTIPFVQAPGNIAARMVDYSPLGAAKGIADIISGATKNNVKAVEKGIEEAAKGLTGTGLIALGMKLKESGLITGTYSKDKKQKAFEKMNGFKEYALHIGDKYFTYGWAQPFAQELMVGTLLQDAIDKSDEYDSDIMRYFGYEGSLPGKAIGVAREGSKAAINSWFNESPLSGLADLLKGNSYEQTDIAGNLWDNGVSDFAGALIPSVVNATAKVVDTTQRNTYNPDNAFASFINANAAKIPGVSKTLPAKYDSWGREMKYAESKGAAAAAKYAIPGEYSYDKGDMIDNEINRLFNEAVDSEGKLIQDAGVFPTVAPNKVGDKTLNNKEVSLYQKDMGQRSRMAVEELINSEAYKSLDDADKVEAIKKIYGASKQITERDQFGKEIAKSSEYKKYAEAYDNAGGGKKGAKAIVDMLSAKATSDAAGLSSNSKAAEEIQKDVLSGNQEAAQEKVEAAVTLQDLGLDKPGPTYTYYKAQDIIPSLTTEDFAKTYKAIDSDGNQGIKQDEVISYLNSKHITSESEAKKIWNAYGNTDWKSIPSLENGKWVKKKKK